MGTVIAYDVLTGDADVPVVDALITLGAPSACRTCRRSSRRRGPATTAGRRSARDRLVDQRRRPVGPGVRVRRGDRPRLPCGGVAPGPRRGVHQRGSMETQHREVPASAAGRQALLGPCRRPLRDRGGPDLARPSARRRGLRLERAVAQLAEQYVRHLRSTDGAGGAGGGDRSWRCRGRAPLHRDPRVADALLGHGLNDAVIKRQFAQALVDRTARQRPALSTRASSTTLDAPTRTTGGAAAASAAATSSSTCWTRARPRLGTYRRRSPPTRRRTTPTTTYWHGINWSPCWRAPPATGSSLEGWRTRGGGRRLAAEVLDVPCERCPSPACGSSRPPARRVSPWATTTWRSPGGDAGSPQTDADTFTLARCCDSCSTCGSSAPHDLPGRSCCRCCARRCSGGTVAPWSSTRETPVRTARAPGRRGGVRQSAWRRCSAAYAPGAELVSAPGWNGAARSPGSRAASPTASAPASSSTARRSAQRCPTGYW